MILLIVAAVAGYMLAGVVGAILAVGIVALFR
jgi:hypothetical protein